MKDVVLVTGNRNFKDYELVRAKLRENLTCAGDGLLLVGDASGADRCAAWAAREIGCWLVDVRRAEWDTEGKRAGPIRNEKLVNEAVRLCEAGRKVLVLAFAVDARVEFAGRGGTADCLARVRKAGLPYELFVSQRWTGGFRWTSLPGASSGQP